jgi:transcriptional regulator with XRE-family HTH domain
VTTFVSKLRQLREGAGLTQGQLARKSRLCEMTLRNYELGATVPSVQSLTQLAKALGVSLEAFDDCT